MRIINQDKTCDIPYENTALNVEEVNENIIDLNAYVNNKWFWLGTYKTEDDAKAVLWDIAANFKVKKDYYEMPQADVQLGG